MAVSDTVPSHEPVRYSLAPPPPPPSFFESLAKAMDLAHARLERTILEQTLRLDDFFGKEKTGTPGETGYEIRWRNAFRFEHGGALRYGGSARVNLTLSKVSNRLKLLFIGDDEPEPITLSLPQDPGNPGLDRTIPTTRFANTELRYELIQRPQLNLFLGTGIRITSPPEAFGRIRFKYIRNVGERMLIFFDETLFANSTSWLGETTEVAFVWQPAPKTIINWGNSGTVSQKVRGLEWGSVLALSRELSPKSAITVSTGIFGNTSLSQLAVNYQVTACYRRNFLRSWLFYELQPEISWPRNAWGDYPATFAFTFRIEVVFKGKAAPLKRASEGYSPEKPYGYGIMRR
ncbi:MAG TPA: hypothetical protein VF799_09765 [Geobacteraceae bacterium]